MQSTTYTYDETSDTLSISFAPGERATGVELTDHIILRINKAERRAIGMTVLDYSLVAQATEIGPRSFPLTGLMELSAEMRELVIDILRHEPVNEIVALSAYTPSMSEQIPIIWLHPLTISA
jgi:uncharacterized protein YuzE